MATPLQSIDPALLALQTAKKAMPASPNTQAVAKPSLNVPKQQSQAISTNIAPPVAKIGGISSPFGATNINSSPVLWWATPQEIGTRAKELQSLPKAIPQTWSQPKTTDNQKYIDLQIDIKKWMPFEKMKELYSDIPESAQSDLYNDLKKGMPIEKIPELYPELQWSVQKQWWGKWQFSPWWIEPFKPVMKTGSWMYNPLKTLANAPWSLANVWINIANMWLSPVETAKGLLKTIVWATNVVWSAIPKAILWDEKYNEVNQKLLNDQGTLWQIRRYASEWWEQAKAVGEYFKGYWDPEELQRRLEEDPAWILSDVATLMWFAWWAIQKAWQVSKLSKVAQVWQKIASLEKYDPYKFLPKATKEIGWKAISKVANIAWEWAVSLLWKATWTSADTIKEVYKAAAQWDTSAIEWIRWAINDETVIENLKRWVQDIIDDRKTMYWKGYEVLKSNLTNVDTTPIAKKTLESLSDMWINFDAQWNLDFAWSTITSPQARSNLQNIVSDLYTRWDNTPKWLDILKQRVADYARYTPEFAKSDRVATMVSNLIKDEIVKVVPEYAEMTKWYAELSNLVKDIKQATWMWRKENISTIWTKLKWLLRDNQEVRKMVVQKMQEATWRNVLWQVAGLQMQPITPRGLMGVWIAWWVALWQISSLINPTYLIPLLATSPRLIGELANAMWVSTKFVTDYYNKFKSYASKYGNNTTNTMNNGGAMGNWLPNRVNEVKPSKWQTPTPPTPKTPPITVEKWAIGMWTPKVNNTPVIPPKATVAPSVSAPKKWMPKLWKEIMEQNLYHGWLENIDSFDVSKAKEWNYWKWIYLTDNKKLAEYYWWLKIKSKELENMPRWSLDFPSDKKWLVSEFKTPKDIKIKEIKWEPTKSMIEQAKKEWYDWIKFPDVLEKQDRSYSLLWDYAEWNTVFIFNTDKVNKLKSLPPLPKKWK